MPAVQPPPSGGGRVPFKTVVEVPQLLAFFLEKLSATLLLPSRDARAAGYRFAQNYFRDLPDGPTALLTQLVDTALLLEEACASPTGSNVTGVADNCCCGSELLTDAARDSGSHLNLALGGFGDKTKTVCRDLQILTERDLMPPSAAVGGAAAATGGQGGAGKVAAASRRLIASVGKRETWRLRHGFVDPPPAGSAAGGPPGPLVAPVQAGSAAVQWGGESEEEEYGGDSGGGACPPPPQPHLGPSTVLQDVQGAPSSPVRLKCFFYSAMADGSSAGAVVAHSLGIEAGSHFDRPAPGTAVPTAAVAAGSNPDIRIVRLPSSALSLDELVQQIEAKYQLPPAPRLSTVLKYADSAGDSITLVDDADVIDMFQDHQDSHARGQDSSGNTASLALAVYGRTSKAAAATAPTAAAVVGQGGGQGGALSIVGNGASACGPVTAGLPAAAEQGTPGRRKRVVSPGTAKIKAGGGTARRPVSPAASLQQRERGWIRGTKNVDADAVGSAGPSAVAAAVGGFGPAGVRAQGRIFKGAAGQPQLHKAPLKPGNGGPRPSAQAGSGASLQVAGLHLTTAGLR